MENEKKPREGYQGKGTMAKVWQRKEMEKRVGAEKGQRKGGKEGSERKLQLFISYLARK